MASTTRPDFDHTTTAAEVAEQFAAQVHGKTVLITGVNKEGLGFSVAQALASQSPANLILAGRTETKVQLCIDALRTDNPRVHYRFLLLDLSSQDGVRSAAKTVLSWSDIPKVDILINSAGVMAIPERTLTPEGIEMHMATNHIGHWLLTNLIMPKLLAATRDQPKGSVRVVNVSSASPQVSGMRWSDMAFERQNKDLPATEQPDYPWFEVWGYRNVQEQAYNPLDGYNRSKVANVLFAIAANRRLFEKHSILSLAVHPGVIMTELGRQFPPETMESVRKMLEDGMFTRKTFAAGGSTSLVAALDPALAKDVGGMKDGVENWGAYLDDCQISGKAHALARSSAEADRLWKLSTELTGENFSW